MSEPDELAALQLEKVHREIEKLRAETGLLKRPWWLQPTYIAAILPILAVAITGWITYSNSDSRRDAEMARAEIAHLKPEADALKVQVSRLQNEEASLKAERARLAAEVRTLQPQATALQKQVVAFNSNISIWRSQLVDINSRLKDVTPHVVGNGVGIFPPPSAEPERKKLQEVIDSMLSTLHTK